MARSRKGSSKKKTNTVSVNFKGVQSRQLLPEDDYRLKLVEANQRESSSGNDQIEWVFAVNDGGKYDGQKLWFYTPLTENSLWKLHALLTAFGVEVPDDELEIDLEQMVEDELEIMGVVQHEPYDGTKRSKMMDFYPVAEAGDEGKSSKDDDEAPKGKGAKGKKKSEPEKVSKEAVEAMDRDELEELISEKELDVDPDDFKKLPKLLAAVLEELEEKDLLEEDEPEEPKGKKGSKKGKSLPKLSSDEVMGMDEDELGEVIEKYELDVDLDDFKTLRKKAAAVVDALEDKDMIEDE